MLIVFQQSPTGMFSIQSEMASFSSSASIVEVENRSQPRDMGCSDGKYAFHNPYCLFLIQALKAFYQFRKWNAKANKEGSVSISA